MGQLVKYPTERAVLQIFFNTAPDKQDKLMKIIYAEAEAFAKNGPDEASLNKVKEYMLKKHNENLKENGYWLNSIDEYLYTGINPIKDYEQIVNGITAKVALYKPYYQQSDFSTHNQSHSFQKAALFVKQRSLFHIH